MLREISLFIQRFKNYCYLWAEEYRKIVNWQRNNLEDKMTLENAMCTIMNSLGILDEQKKLLKANINVRTKREKGLLKDLSFYRNGFEYFGFENHDSHNENTNLTFVSVTETPEKIMASLAQEAIVIGISATAEFRTVIGNYDLDYLERVLKEHYHSSPESLKERNRQKLEKQWKNYRNGKIQIKVNKIKNLDKKEIDIKEIFSEHLGEEAAEIIENKIGMQICGDKEQYIKARYCNMFKAFCAFMEEEAIYSMLYLGMKLPQNNDSKMDETFIKEIFEMLKRCYRKRDGQKVDLAVLKSTGYERDKEDLLVRLANGEKIFVISTYRTIGAGQNLQYDVPEKLKNQIVYLGHPVKSDDRYRQKDFDALYLGDITSLTINTYDEDALKEEDLLKLLFQIEELTEAGDLSLEEKHQYINMGFKKYTGASVKKSNKLFYKDNVTAQAGRGALQAVGRICRTFVKSPSINIFIEEKLMNKIDTMEMKERILPPEMQAIVEICEKNVKTYTSDEKKALNIAENKSVRGSRLIRRLLNSAWVEVTMKDWMDLREIALAYPTADESLYAENLIVEQYYITSGKKQNCYIYTQVQDYTDVLIDFSTDKTAFRSGQRYKSQKEKAGAIYDMSAEAAHLDVMMKYQGMRAYFKEKGYATEFKENMYLLSPVMFNNIYKGALGETVGKYILEKELGIKLDSITSPEEFEFFDFKIGKDVYVDFKNWKYTFTRDKSLVREQILSKLSQIGGKRVYIINIYTEKDFEVQKNSDERIIEVPRLLNQDGKIDAENIACLLKEI